MEHRTLGRRFVCPIDPATQGEFILDWRIFTTSQFSNPGRATLFHLNVEGMYLYNNSNLISKRLRPPSDFYRSGQCWKLSEESVNLALLREIPKYITKTYGSFLSFLSNLNLGMAQKTNVDLVQQKVLQIIKKFREPATTLQKAY